MREVVYHHHAARYMKPMPGDRKQQVKAAVLEVAAFADMTSNQNVKAMKGEWDGCFRLRVGRYRAIFQLSSLDGIERLEVLVIGPRGDIY